MERPAIEASMEDPGVDTTSWPTAQKLLFRFGCLYFLWHATPDLAAGHDTFLSIRMDRMAAWIGENILGLGEINSEFTSSGDMMVHYVKLLVMLISSLAGCLLWTLLDRRRPHYRRLGEWLLVACRYYLLLVMLGYGFAKIFPSQILPPSLARLLQTFGDASPMGLLWTTLGHSKAYTVFGGLGEVVGGLLLAWRRTTTLGALIIVAVMTNVVMMNFSYDVPVKVYSCHLLLLALILVALDWRRVLNILVFNRPAAAALYPPHFATPTGRIRARVVKVLVIGLLLAFNFWRGLEAERMNGRHATKPPLWGIYDVETFIVDGEVLPPLLTDTRRWQNVIFDRRHELGVRMMDGKIRHDSFAIEGGKRLSIFRDDATGSSFTKSSWMFERPSPGVLHMAGELDGSTISLEMKARDPNDFLLLNRGFHWINEVPFNH